MKNGTGNVEGCGGTLIARNQLPKAAEYPQFIFLQDPTNFSYPPGIKPLFLPTILAIGRTENVRYELPGKIYSTKSTV